MTVADKFSIVVLLLLFAAQLLGRNFTVKYIRFCFFLSVAAAFSSAFYFTFSLYRIWENNPLSAFLLPPHASWKYFASYVIPRFFSPLLVSLVFALALKIISEFLNKRFGERFFEKEEGWLMATGIFLSGYPGLLIYAPFMLISGLLLTVIYSILKKGRAPFFYLWLPVAVFAILLKSQIPQSFLNNFII
ncbi:MAG TPA: hypothetical protein VMV71_00215 [Candidatus Paceibacterota bacterium]|nr:hypothetical protein [Candidatus Paceibacterota bacterium]